MANSAPSKLPTSDARGPKAIVREMWESGMTFTELVARYQLGRSEGVVLRYLTDRAVQRRALGSRLSTLPWGTMTVNVVGSFVLGVVASASSGTGWPASIISILPSGRP